MIVKLFGLFTIGFHACLCVYCNRPFKSLKTSWLSDKIRTSHLTAKVSIFSKTIGFEANRSQFLPRSATATGPPALKIAPPRLMAKPWLKLKCSTPPPPCPGWFCCRPNWRCRRSNRRCLCRWRRLRSRSPRMKFLTRAKLSVTSVHIFTICLLHKSCYFSVSLSYVQFLLKPIAKPQL